MGDEAPASALGDDDPVVVQGCGAQMHRRAACAAAAQGLAVDHEGDQGRVGAWVFGGQPSEMAVRCLIQVLADLVQALAQRRGIVAECGHVEHEARASVSRFRSSVVIKMLKRQMFGRAGFPLLRKRILHPN